MKMTLNVRSIIVMVITVSDKSSDEAMSKILFEEYPVRAKKNNLQEKSGRKVNNKTTTTTATSNKHCNVQIS